VDYPRFGLGRLVLDGTDFHPDLKGLDNERTIEQAINREVRAALAELKGDRDGNI